MFKKIISLLVLTTYLHGLSGYTMSFHKCIMSGTENVFASYSKADPCVETEKDCQQTTPHFKKGSCCQMQYATVSINDDSNVSYFKTHFFTSTIYHLLYQTISPRANCHYYFCSSDFFNIRPPELSKICILRI